MKIQLSENAYIQPRLRIVGYVSGSPFSAGGFKRIFEHTRGLRRIDCLCLPALIAGRIDQKQIPDDSTLLKAIAAIDQG